MKKKKKKKRKCISKIFKREQWIRDCSPETVVPQIFRGYGRPFAVSTEMTIAFYCASTFAVTYKATI